MAMKLKDKTVKVLKETAKEYAVMIMGEKVGSVTKLRQNQWQLRMNEDSATRKRRPFTSLRVARNHVLALSRGDV